MGSILIKIKKIKTQTKIQPFFKSPPSGVDTTFGTPQNKIFKKDRQKKRRRCSVTNGFLDPPTWADPPAKIFYLFLVTQAIIIRALHHQPISQNQRM